MSDADFPAITFKEKRISLTGTEEQTIHGLLDKGDWVEWDGDDMPQTGLFKGMKGYLLEGERLSMEYDWTIRPLDSIGYLPTDMLIQFMEHTNFPDNVLTCDRSMLKPSTPYTREDRDKGGNQINITDSVVLNSNISIGGKDGLQRHD